MARTPLPSPRIDTRYAYFALSIRPSRIHRYGVYAREAIPANRRVMEYRGERITAAEAKERDVGGYTYLFEQDAQWTIDGAVGGSGAEIINHSCDPNLISLVTNGRILFMSLRAIRSGEELTIDYRFSGTIEETRCCCGATICRGTI